MCEDLGSYRLKDSIHQLVLLTTPRVLHLVLDLSLNQMRYRRFVLDVDYTTYMLVLSMESRLYFYLLL